ncbi:glycosyltransferase family 39 protein [Flavobacterium urocaniciphilum]|uniref:Dolichyl-phosphate-mannose-protein mannosyltransferase n=1 Tax=Flavobacterium urocaniciphilum TaxID=1299341 RepID=A0A1H9DI90_9FLAO|nr:glycosyltransferase family 39 protein [Flavobacterium urocaniciphilum]SEQ12493.1 Dolichyl-phosphate-mannose-protein mannosyltransferase [Flavobacterium urocaniciphilum]
MSKKYAIYCFPILFWIICYFGFSFDGLYGQDAYEYFRYTKSLHNYLTSGELPGDYFWGVYYPLFGSFLMLVLGKTPIALQLISVFSLIISSIYATKIIELIYKEKGNSILIFLVFSCSPILLIHSVLSMSDLLSCCLLLLTFYHFLVYLEKSKDRSFLIGVCFCLIALLTRYATGIIVLPITIMVFLKLWKDKPLKLLLISIPILLIIIAPHIVIKSQKSLQFLSHSWLQNWNILNIFKSDFVTQEGPRSNHFINLIYICFTFLHPIFMFFGLGIIGYSIKNRFRKWNKYQILLAVSILVFSLFIGGIPYQNKRYLIPAFALIVILIYPQVKNIISFFNYKKPIYFVVFFIQLSFTFYFGKQFLDRNKLEKSIVKEMKPFQGNTLYIFDIDVAMQGRGLQFNYKNLFIEKYKVYEKNALILINEKQLEKDWKDKNPLINWNQIQNQCELKKLQLTNKDWSLYQITALK